MLMVMDSAGQFEVGYSTTATSEWMARTQEEENITASFLWSVTMVSCAFRIFKKMPKQDVQPRDVR